MILRNDMSISCDISLKRRKWPYNCTVNVPKLKFPFNHLKCWEHSFCVGYEKKVQNVVIACKWIIFHGFENECKNLANFV